MVYSTVLKSLIGELRSKLATEGITRQSDRYRQHGAHQAQAEGPLVLVACSGGRDSLALAWVAHTVCGSLGVRCGAVIVDHALFDGSAELTQSVVERCEGIGLNPVCSRRITVPRTGQGVEAAAREARYAAICSVARQTNADLVLLAHTADDQAETVLMGLLRGGGLSALAGMPQGMSRDGVRFLRPLIDCSRKQTTQACEDLGLDWWDDPTNGEDMQSSLSADYPLRSRVRHDLIPQITAFWGSDIVPQLAIGAKSAQRDLQYLESQTDQVIDRVVKVPRSSIEDQGSGEADFVLPEAQLLIDAEALAKEHTALRFRVLSRCMAKLGLPPARRQIKSLDTLAVDWHGQGPIVINGGYYALRRGHVILICKDGWHANR
jgi:tRNA(Ile)-lysidine synthase